LWIAERKMLCAFFCFRLLFFASYVEVSIVACASHQPAQPNYFFNKKMSVLIILTVVFACKY